VGHLAHRLWS